VELVYWLVSLNCPPPVQYMHVIGKWHCAHNGI